MRVKRGRSKNSSSSAFVHIYPGPKTLDGIKSNVVGMARRNVKVVSVGGPRSVRAWARTELAGMMPMSVSTHHGRTRSALAGLGVRDFPRNLPSSCVHVSVGGREWIIQCGGCTRSLASNEPSTSFHGKYTAY